MCNKLARLSQAMIWLQMESLSALSTKSHGYGDRAHGNEPRYTLPSRTPPLSGVTTGYAPQHAPKQSCLPAVAARRLAAPIASDSLRSDGNGPSLVCKEWHACVLGTLCPILHSILDA